MKTINEELKDQIAWMTVGEVAIHLRVSKRVIYNLTSSGYLPYYKIGGRNRFLKSEIDQLILKQRVGT